MKQAKAVTLGKGSDEATNNSDTDYYMAMFDMTKLNNEEKPPTAPTKTEATKKEVTPVVEKVHNPYAKSPNRMHPSGSTPTRSPPTNLSVPDATWSSLGTCREQLRTFQTANYPTQCKLCLGNVIPGQWIEKYVLEYQRGKFTTVHHHPYDCCSKPYELPDETQRKKPLYGRSYQYIGGNSYVPIQFENNSDSPSRARSEPLEMNSIKRENNDKHSVQSSPARISIPTLTKSDNNVAKPPPPNYTSFVPDGRHSPGLSELTGATELVGNTSSTNRIQARGLAIAKQSFNVTPTKINTKGMQPDYSAALDLAKLAEISTRDRAFATQTDKMNAMIEYTNGTEHADTELGCQAREIIRNLDADFGKEASAENKKEDSDNIENVMQKDREDGKVSFRIHSNYLFNSEE